jgi:hypothetical protein
MKKKPKQKADQLAHSFYMTVFAYISEEYKPRLAKLFADSEISPQIYDLCGQYYWGGNSVPFTAGQIVDLLKSKYKSV